MIDPNFDIDRVVFSGQELMQLINSKKLKRGSCIMFDEMSIDMDNRNWNSTTNKMINYLMQTFRYRGFIMLMNSPFLDFIDSKTRKLFHAEIGIAMIDYDTEECYLTPRIIQYNGRFQKFYYKRLKVKLPNGAFKPIDMWKVPKPSKELLKEYEKKKDHYAQLLNKRIEKELNQVANPVEKKDGRKKVIDMAKFKDALNEGLSVSALCARFDISYGKCNILKSRVKQEKIE